MKLCILFPGMGYHCDKPLLYYSSKLAQSKGYEVVTLNFSGFPDNAKNDEELLRKSADIAFNQSVEQLKDIDFSKYEKVVFIGKSIGTVAMQMYRRKFNVNAVSVLLTPVEYTFENTDKSCTAFHGTADPIADTAIITQFCSEQNIQLYKYENANHSIETKDVITNLEYLRDVINKVEKLL